MSGKRWSLRVTMFLALAILVLSTLTGAPAVHGQAQTWSRPVMLSAPISSSWFPDVAADSTGRVHVVWSMAVGDYDTVMYTSSADGQVWDGTTDIAAFPQLAGSEATRPTILVDTQDSLQVTFRQISIYYMRAPVRSAYSMAAWLQPHVMSGGEIAYYSRLVTDQSGTLHLVYTENVMTSECPICYHLFYRRSEDNGQSWSAAMDISDLPTGSAKPGLVLDKQNNLHVVWEAGVGGSYGQVRDPIKVMYAASYDGGKSWSRPMEFPTPSGKARNIALGMDGQGKLVAVWVGVPEDTLYFSYSSNQGRAWSVPQRISGVWGGMSVYGTLLDNYAMATDSAGKIHLVLVGRTTPEQQSLSLLHLVWDGSDWSTLETITTVEGDVPEWPRIAIGKGNELHVVWFLRDAAHVWDSDHAQYRVWYSRGTALAPTITPAATPVATATPEPQTPVTPAPSPTPPPKVNPAVSDVSVQTVATESNSLILLAQSALPALVLVVAVVVGARIRRR